MKNEITNLTDEELIKILKRKPLNKTIELCTSYNVRTNKHTISEKRLSACGWTLNDFILAVKGILYSSDPNDTLEINKL